MSALTREQILRALRPDLESGHFYWLRPSKYHNEKIGQKAGFPRHGRCGKFYWIIKINGCSYRRSHLIYCVVHGSFPAKCIDHKNGDSLDDRPSNLRQATVTQNAWNHRTRARSIPLPMGVRIIPKSRRYQARIACNKKMFHLGAFDTPEEAHAVYLAKRKELFGEFA